MTLAGRTAVLIAAAAACCTGCIPRRQVRPAEMDRWWGLEEPAWPAAKPKVIDVGGRAVPTDMTVYQEPSLIWSTVSLVRATDRIQQGARRVELAISPTHATMLADVMGDAREVIGNLRNVVEMKSTGDPRQWAQGVTDALVLVEKIARETTPPGHAGAAHRADADGADNEGLAWSAGPMLQMLAGYLHNQAGDGLLDSLGAEETRRLRDLLTQTVLRISFAAAGKQDSPELRRDLQARMTGAPSEQALRSDLERTLLEAIDQAPPAVGSRGLSEAIRTALSAAPRALEAMEKLARQWDRVESVRMEIRERNEQTLVGFTVRVQPGKEVRLDGLVIMQPVLAIRGACRIVVRPKVGRTGQTVVRFEPIDDGGTSIRFPGLGWALVRLVALPIEDATVREVRVSSGGFAGREMLNVTMVLQADGGDDPRRLIVFQQDQHQRLVRRAMSVEQVPVRKTQAFSYVTPRGRYTYVRRTSEP